MVCIYCGFSTRVINSRSQKKSIVTWRRRECERCGAVFTTRERPDLEQAIRIRAPKGRLQPFKRDKLLISLHTSLSHRSTALGDAEGLVETIIAQLLTYTKNGLLTAELIRKETSATLLKFDLVAATHYNAYHPINSTA